jgi:hypothetical protein
VATNWVPENQFINPTASTTLATALTIDTTNSIGSVAPSFAAGDIVFAWWTQARATNWTSAAATIADTTVGGGSWAANGSGIQFFTSGTPRLAGLAWAKILNANDATAYNLGTAVVTVTATGGSGSITAGYIQVDQYRVTGGGTVQGVDVYGGGSSVASTTTSIVPSNSSSETSNTDQLAVCGLYTGINSNGGLTGTNQFQNTSASPVNYNLTSNGGANDDFLVTQYVGGVQTVSSGLAMNWTNTWTNSVRSILFGFTVYYTGGATTTLPPRTSVRRPQRPPAIRKSTTRPFIAPTEPAPTTSHRPAPRIPPRRTTRSGEPPWPQRNPPIVPAAARAFRPRPLPWRSRKAEPPWPQRNPPMVPDTRRSYRTFLRPRRSTHTEPPLAQAQPPDSYRRPRLPVFRRRTITVAPPLSVVVPVAPAFVPRSIRQAGKMLRQTRGSTGDVGWFFVPPPVPTTGYPPWIVVDGQLAWHVAGIWYMRI